jgi:hypothetical protein
MQWQMMNSKDLLNDSQIFFSPPDSSSTMNEDGSWYTSRKDLLAKEGLTIMNVRSPEGTKWKDIEMTGYVRLIS